MPGDDVDKLLENLTEYDIKFEYYRRNTMDYINECVCIEDKDTDGVVIDFELWPVQEKVLELIEKENYTIFGKTRQLGLTWLALAKISNLIVFNPGKTASAISEGERDVKELCKRMDFILRHLPNWLITEKGEDKEWEENRTGIVYVSNVTSVEIIHPDGENSLFRGFPSKPSAARSFTDNIILMDEWAYHPRAEEIWDAAFPIVNRPNSNAKVIGVSTGEMGTFFEEMWNDAEWEFKGESGNGSNLFKGMFIPWDAHPDRDEEWYENTIRNMKHGNPKSQYPSTPSEMFTTGSGAFFPEFRRKIHVPYGRDWYPPSTWRIIGAYDGGFNRACFKWYAISNDGWIICYREYYPQYKADPVQAREIRKLSKDPDGNPEQIHYIIADTSCWRKDRNYQKKKGRRNEEPMSTVEVMREFGIRPWKKADKDRIPGWRRLHEYLSPVTDENGDYVKDQYGNIMAQLRYTEACGNTIRLFPGMKADETKPEDLASGQEDHVFDCDRYMVMSRPKSPTPKAERERQNKKRREQIKPRSKSVGY